MPRFRLSLADASDLVAYVKRLGDAIDPGVTAETVRLGVLTAPRQAVRAAGPFNELLAYFARVNAGGGIFGRRVELSFLELPVDASLRAGAVREFLGAGQVFAVVGDFTGAESELAAAMRDTATPAIAAFAPFPATASPLNRYVFYLNGGLAGELQALVDFAAKRFPATEIVASDTGISADAAKWLAGNIRVGDGAPGAAYWLRPDLQGAERFPVLLIPGSLCDCTSFPRDTKVFVAPPQIASARDRVFASAAIVTEAFRLAGRDLSRAGFIAALESFRDVQTNLQGPISFGLSRRVGMDGSGIHPVSGSIPMK